MEQELEQANLEIDTLREECQKGLKQNAQLLRLMSNLESKMSSNGSGSGTGGKGASDRNTSSSPARNRDREKDMSEVSLARVNEKLKAASLKVQDLERVRDSSDAALLSLKATLRDKNEEIRELKRNITEISRHNAMTGSNGNNAGNANSVGGQVSGSKTKASAELMAEAKPGGGLTPRDSKGSKQSSPRSPRA